MSDVRNVISIICHDLGRELGCYGRPVRSPNLDRFAGESVRFANAHCNAVACTPARVSLMTGQHAHQVGVLGLAHQRWPLPTEQRTIIDAFNDAGYETAHTGHHHERLDAHDNRYRVELRQRRADDLAENSIDAAIEYLHARRDRDRPFYLKIGLRETHPSLWNPAHGRHRPEYDPFLPSPTPEPPGITPEDRPLVAPFYAAIGYLDQQLGRLLATLEELGYLDDSLVTFTTDHGRALGPRSKGTLYELGTAVALMVRLPAGAHGGRVNHGLAQHIDVAPTLLEAAGVPAPPAMTGRSFWGELARGAEIERDVIFTERTYHGGPSSPDYYEPTRACRTADHLYVRRFSAHHEPAGPREHELYAVGDDPFTERNVADDPAHRERVEALDGKLMQWMRDTADPLLTGHVPDPFGVLT